MVIRGTSFLILAVAVVASEAVSFRGQGYRTQDEVNEDQRRDLRVTQAIKTSEAGDEFTADWRVSHNERNVGVVSPWHKVFLNAATKGLYNM